MRDDIVERMRFWSKTRNDNPTPWNLDCGYAADAIERLTAERDKARQETCYELSGWKQSAYEQEARAEAKRRGWDCFKEASDEQ